MKNKHVPPCSLTKLGIKHGKTADSWVYTYEGRNTCLCLDSLRVRKDAPKGTGTSIMEQLIEIADRNGWTITLSLAGKEDFQAGPEWKKTTSSARLQRFYRRFGFKKNSTAGRFDLRGYMHRTPKPAAKLQPA